MGYDQRSSAILTYLLSAFIESSLIGQSVDVMFARWTLFLRQMISPLTVFLFAGAHPRRQLNDMKRLCPSDEHMRAPTFARGKLKHARLCIEEQHRNPRRAFDHKLVLVVSKTRANVTLNKRNSRYGKCARSFRGSWMCVEASVSPTGAHSAPLMTFDPRDA